MSKITSLNGGRIRKVTITEIEDEEEWNWPDPGCFEEEDDEAEEAMKSADEVFDELENVVQDWKKQLEVIVAEGLKTIKKTTKEKRAMMKYVPGDGLIGGSNKTLQARCQILTEWKDDITAAIDATHQKLNNLGVEGMKNTSQAVKNVAPEVDSFKENGCTTVSLDFETLMRDLDILYNKYHNANAMNKVPIYNVKKDFVPMNNSPLPWWKPISTYAQMVDSPIQVSKEPKTPNPNILSILQDFVSDQKSQKTIMEEWKKMEEKKRLLKEKKEGKPTRRGRDSSKKMKERKEIRKYKQFLMREIVKKGETHYYLMKKEVKEPDMTEVEDIFADWKQNLETRKRKTVKPRVRKISHRAERKEMLKEVKSELEKTQGPLTYSQMLRKNLKIPVEGPAVEEMFGPWMKNVEKMYKPQKPTNAADEVEMFSAWNFIFEDKPRKVSITAPSLASLECGQPTVPTMNTKSSRCDKKTVDKANKKQAIDKLSAKLMAEGYPLGQADEKSKAVVVRAKTELVPYVEKKPLFETIPKIAPAAKDFKPSKQSQVNPGFKSAPQQSTKALPKTYIPPPPPMPKFDWSELLASAEEKSGRGEAAQRNKPEEIFDQWRHIFIDANKTKTEKKIKSKAVREYKEDFYFLDFIKNFDEPVGVKIPKKERKESVSEKENKTPSPKSSKRAEKKQLREEFINDDVTEMKDNRRNDFMKNQKIKDKKRTEASRNSLGKRVK